MNFLLSREKRNRLRRVAREEYATACALFPDLRYQKSDVRKLAIQSTRRKLAKSTEYGGLINALLLSVATKFIVAMIEHWIDENLTASDVSEQYSKGEPGYE